MNKENLGILITDIPATRARMENTELILNSKMVQEFQLKYHLDSMSMILINPGSKTPNQVLIQVTRELKDIAQIINDKGNIICAAILIDVCIPHQYPCILAAHISHLAPITDGIVIYHMGEFIPVCPSNIPNNNNVLNHLHTNDPIVCNELRP